MGRSHELLSYRPPSTDLVPAFGGNYWGGAALADVTRQVRQWSNSEDPRRSPTDLNSATVAADKYQWRFAGPGDPSDLFYVAKKHIEVTPLAAQFLKNRDPFVDMDMAQTSKETLPFLMSSLKEAQDNVRAYDVKAQIVGVGYIFAIGIIVDVGSRISGMPDAEVGTITLAWLLIIVPIALFGAVLYPSRRSSPKLGEKGGGVDYTY